MTTGETLSETRFFYAGGNGRNNESPWELGNDEHEAADARAHTSSQASTKITRPAE